MKPLLIDFGLSETLSAGLLEHLPAELGRATSRRFPDGESYLRMLSDCVGRHVIIASSLNDPDPKLANLIFAAQLARDLGAASVGLIAPYLAYMRQDHRFAPGEAVTAKYFAGLVARDFDWLATVDPHLHRFASLDQVYTIPARHAQAAGKIGAWLVENAENPLLIGPDSESEQWVAEAARAADAAWTVLEKKRYGDDQVEISIPDLEGHAGRQPVLLDDIISTGSTMIATLRHLSAHRGPAPICIGVHGLFVENAYQALHDAKAARVITCNTVAHPSNQIDISNELAATAAGLLPA